MTPFLSRDGMHLWYADARRVSEFIEPESVDLLVTSPPYWEQRAYTDGGVRYEGQIGSEPTSREFLDNLIACTADWAKVLKPTGSMFVNLGDKYVNKVLLGLPWRYANRVADELGLILRAEIVWEKVNGLPESAEDRVHRSHEHIFHFTRQGRYFSAVDEIREPYDAPTASRTPGVRQWAFPGPHGPTRIGDAIDTMNPLGKSPGSVWSIPSEPLQVPDHLNVQHFAAFPTEIPRRCILGWSPNGICLECGEGRRPVSEVQPDEGLTGPPVETRRKEPTADQERAIAAFIRQHRTAKGMTIRQVDAACGGGMCSWWEGRPAGIHLPPPAAWRRLVEVLALPPTWDHVMLDTYMRQTGTMRTLGTARTVGRHQTTGHTRLSLSTIITGYACACPTPDAPTRPAVILDPFGGTGTTALVARALGRDCHHVDLSNDYLRLAEWRIWSDTNAHRKASERSGIKVPEPPKIDGQLSMLDALG